MPKWLVRLGVALHLRVDGDPEAEDETRWRVETLLATVRDEHEDFRRRMNEVPGRVRRDDLSDAMLPWRESRRSRQSGDPAP